MYKLLHMLSENRNLSEYKDMKDLTDSVQRYGCDGFEIIRCGEDARNIIDKGMIIGYHAAFYSDWLDFYLEDKVALNRKFGSEGVWSEFYGGNNKRALIDYFKNEMDIAKGMNAKYVVFHVSDVSLQEGYTYKWEHTDEMVIDNAASLINEVLADGNYDFDFLMENLWWAGFTMTDSVLTRRLLDKVNYKKKGIMLDLGHLMNTNLNLQNEEQACEYIADMVYKHKDLQGYIRGVHIHKSITGDYVKGSLENIPILTGDFYEQFSVSYKHVLSIDRHEVMTGSGTRGLIEYIKPEYLLYEFKANNRQDRENKLREQASIFL